MYRRSLEQGVDISIQAATKYIGGHSDIMFGLENVEDLKADLARCFAAFNAA